MNQAKSGNMGRGAPVEDPKQIHQTLLALLQSEAEFPLKVEGTHTLPYTAMVKHLDIRQGLMHLKLIRPLPHELAEGAAFRMLFTAGDQRFEAPTLFRGREGYLLYRFSIPVHLAASDRRRHPRYPFRPRERAYVVAQDASLPGFGISGPLVNLSLGGLALRVDRIMRLDDHLRVNPGLGFFDRGKSFPMLKIRDLPNLPAFDARGTLCFAEERGGEIIVGIQFGELRESELAELQGVLTLRENMKRASPVPSGGSVRESGPRAEAATSETTVRVAPAGGLTPDALLRLGRRCTRVVLALPGGPDRDQLLQALAEGGYFRVEALDSVEQALEQCRAAHSQADTILMTGHSAETAARFEGLLGNPEPDDPDQDLQVALISPEAPPPVPATPGLHILPWPRPGDLSWRPQLDGLAGLES